MKKLTAGIFTVMLGLCATSGADAAVASQGYVDTKVGVNTQSITTLTQTVADNKSAAETAIADAKKAGTDAAAALETYKTDNNAALELKANSADVYTKTEAETKFMDSTEVSTAITNAVTGDEGFLKDYVTDTALTESQTAQDTTLKAYADSVAATAKSGAEATAASALSEYKSTNDAAVAAAKSAADAAQTTADGAVSVNATQATAISANTTAIATLNGNDQTEGSVAYKVKALADGAVATNTAAIETNADDISGLKTLVGTTAVATQISSAIADANLSQYATKEGLTGALADYAKTEELKALAKKDTVGTNDIDNLAVTTGKLANGAVTADKLGADAVTNAAVADGALSQGKISGLNTTLAAKMDITSTKTEAGKYVFTANVGENGVTDYAWEEIARD